MKQLLQSVDVTIKQQKEIQRLRGEDFNVFSILGIESRENKTHSAFLGELLNPQGTHGFGSRMLELFLQTIGLPSRKFDVSDATIRLEAVCGNRDDVLKSGGRIDILLRDRRGKTVCIENKIYAGDQNAQIERYVNYNKANNTVYYLTLDGRPASSQSKGNLQDDQDYYCISYSTTILTWLEQCYREAAAHPILRESIRQYIILVKKLTHQLIDKTMEQNVFHLIASNYESAKVIADNIGKVEAEQANRFLNEVKELCLSLLGDKWQGVVDNDLNASWAGLSISHPSWNGITVRLQGEPKLIGGRSIYGVVAPKNEWSRVEVEKNLSSCAGLTVGWKSSAHWPCYQDVNLFLIPGDFNKLFDTVMRKSLVQSTSDLLSELARLCYEPLQGISRVKQNAN